MDCNKNEFLYLPGWEVPVYASWFDPRPSRGHWRTSPILEPSGRDNATNQSAAARCYGSHFSVTPTCLLAPPTPRHSRNISDYSSELRRSRLRVWQIVVLTPIVASAATRQGQRSLNVGDVLSGDAKPECTEGSPGERVGSENET